MTFICNTNLIIDNFNTKGVAGVIDYVYVLTHFHSDHRPGLDKSFRGRLICSPTTAELVCAVLNVNPAFVEELAIGKELEISMREGACISRYSITFIDANHCPGSVSVIVKGLEDRGFLYYYMADSRVNSNVIADAVTVCKSQCDIAWVDSTFWDNRWNSMPTKDESVESLMYFVRLHADFGFALELELLGTEIFIHAILAEYPRERILVMGNERWNELEILFSGDMSRFELYHENATFINRFVIQQRRFETPVGYYRVRATTQRWFNHVNQGGSCAFLEVVDMNCFVFFSMHSSKKEIDQLTNALGAKRIVKSFESIPVERPLAETPPRSRRARHVRRAFEFSSGSIWLNTLIDSQETVCPIFQKDEITLPTWE